MDLNTLKEILPANRVIGHYLLGRDDLSGDRKYCCPFHREKTPSFNVSDKRGHYKCFGCGVGGDIIKFVMDFKNISFFDAIQEINEVFGTDVAVSGTLTKENLKVKTILAAHERLNDFYHAELFKPENKRALDILVNERKLSIETIKKFKLGYSTPRASETFANGLVLESKGLIVKTDLSCFSAQSRYIFDDRITYPIRNLRGKVISWSAGRTKRDQEPKYIHSANNLVYQKSKTLFNIDKADLSSRNIILCEGNVDSIQLYEYGNTNNAALLGTAFSDEQLRLFADRVDTVTLLLDNDAAGEKAKMEIAKKLFAAGKAVFIVPAVVGGKDIDDFLKANVHLKNGEIDDWIEENKQELLEEYLIKGYALNAERLPIENRIAILSAIKELYSCISDEVLRNAYKTTMDKYGIDFSDLEEEMKRRAKEDEKVREEYVPKMPKMTAQELTDLVATIIIVDCKENGGKPMEHELIKKSSGVPDIEFTLTEQFFEKHYALDSGNAWIDAHPAEMIVIGIINPDTKTILEALGKLASKK